MTPDTVLRGLFDRLFTAWNDFDNALQDPTEDE